MGKHRLVMYDTGGHEPSLRLRTIIMRISFVRLEGDCTSTWHALKELTTAKI